jgi:3-hydroxyacyl-[acyl-carrier-protein] dehydratase
VTPSHGILGIPEIQSIQQNRFPNLFVDRITSLDPGKKAVGFKNFTFNEWFFPSHFPGDPSVPGYILLESAAQIFLVAFLTLEENKGSTTSFISIEDFQFKKKVIPGDRLIIEAELTDFRRGIAKGRILGYVDEYLCITGNLKIGVNRTLGTYTEKLSKQDSQ